MAKRNNDKNKFIKINPINNSEEGLMAVALLNALTLLEAEKNPLVKIPNRKELTKLFKTAKMENIIKALEEVNNIRIRPIIGIEETADVAIIFIDHPIVNKIPCLAYRTKELSKEKVEMINSSVGDNVVLLVNSGLGEDILAITEEQFNNRLQIPDNTNRNIIQGYQVILNTGEKEILDNEEVDCNDCNRLHFEGLNEICLYDNKKIDDCNKCCNKYINCFNWKTPKSLIKKGE
ncbi:MAG: hypothetical protein IJH34_05975 [Romboutsia sp.]|nr:hypothetical protein [Romboutsia sp.]